MHDDLIKAWGEITEDILKLLRKQSHDLIKRHRFAECVALQLCIRDNIMVCMAQTAEDFVKLMQEIEEKMGANNDVNKNIH